jgi:hypothetical protein
MRETGVVVGTVFLAAGFAACGIDGPRNETQGPVVTLQANSGVPGYPTPYAGGPGVLITARTNRPDGLSWTLDGPGRLEGVSELEAVYTPPAVMDADRDVTVTAIVSGADRSLLIHVVAHPPFTLGATSVTLTPAGPPVAIDVRYFNPAVQTGFGCVYVGVNAEVDCDRYPDPVILVFPAPGVTSPGHGVLRVMTGDEPPFEIDVQVTTLQAPPP